MNKPVKLKHLVDEMEMIFDNYTTFYHSKSGKFYSISGEAFIAVEDEEDISELGDDGIEEIDIANDIYENSSDYIELPDKYEINEYEMLDDFSVSVEDEQASRMLQIAIKGPGAFRRFRDMIRELNLEQEWYFFRDEKYKEKAIKWCHVNKLEYKD